jgi:serine/threonine-protein kinase/endoribonuclease IRE1
MENEHLWIVEPTQNGKLYVYNPSQGGIHDLGLTVKQLVDFSPFAGEEPHVVYTAEKRTALYTVDARTGTIDKIFSSGGSSALNDTSCEPSTGFVETNKECKGHLTLGQTQYTVDIANRLTGQSICTIRYFEWTPNMRDQDLYSEYSETMDKKYVYSKYDGTIFAMDHTTQRKVHPIRPVYTRKFPSPVVRVFDVARPFQDESDDPALVILPQPRMPGYVDSGPSDIWVNCTESGGWYAMSESTYPAVTDGASQAQCYRDSVGKPGDLFLDNKGSLPPLKSLVGVHSIASTGESAPGFGEHPAIGAPSLDPIDEVREPEPPAAVVPDTGDHHQSKSGNWLASLIVTAAILFPLAMIYHKPSRLDVIISTLIKLRTSSSPGVLNGTVHRVPSSIE